MQAIAQVVSEVLAQEHVQVLAKCVMRKYTSAQVHAQVRKYASAQVLLQELALVSKYLRKCANSLLATLQN